MKIKTKSLETKSKSLETKSNPVEKRHLHGIKIFLHGISLFFHEIKTFLNGIILNLGNGHAKDSEQKSYVYSNQRCYAKNIQLTRSELATLWVICANIYIIT